MNKYNYDDPNTATADEGGSGGAFDTISWN